MPLPAVAALIAAEAVTASLVLAAVSQVGLVMSVVGVVTGNKDLLKIGGVLGLVGGVGSLVSGAASGGAAAASETVAGAGAETAVGTAADVATNTAADALTQSAGALESGITPLADTASVASMPIPDASAIAVAPPPMTEAVSSMSPPAVSQVGVDPTTVADVKGAADWQSGVSDPMTRELMGINPPKDGNDFFLGFSDFASKNKNMLMSGIKGAYEEQQKQKDRAIAQQKNDIDQQKVNQTSYGSAVAASPTARPAGISGAMQ